MVNTWYTADLHFGHKNIMTYCDRPWATTQEMDAAMVDRWNSVVAPGDTVWVLGDVALSPSKIGPVAQLTGTKILVAGNHDACWHVHRKSSRMMPVYADAGFDVIHETGIVDEHQVGPHAVKLAHLPYAGDHTEEDRYANRRPVDDGDPLICGHVHTAWRTTGRQINVGVDVWDYAPVHEDTLVNLIDQLPAP